MREYKKVHLNSTDRPVPTSYNRLANGVPLKTALGTGASVSGTVMSAITDNIWTSGPFNCDTFLGLSASTSIPFQNITSASITPTP